MAQFSDLFARTMTAIILVVVVLYITYLGGVAFGVLVTVIATIMAYEWLKLVKPVTPFMQRFWWQMVGFIYVLLPAYSLWYLREVQGFQLIFWVFVVVWATDIGAYFSGRLIGGPKIAPSISPNKTWAGLIGGMGCAVIAGNMVYWSTIYDGILLSLIAASMAVVGQIGDFFESWMKRKFNVKDTGTILPGHGGILDRVDALVFVAPVITFCAMRGWLW